MGDGSCAPVNVAPPSPERPSLCPEKFFSQPLEPSISGKDWKKRRAENVLRTLILTIFPSFKYIFILQFIHLRERKYDLGYFI